MSMKSEEEFEPDMEEEFVEEVEEDDEEVEQKSDESEKGKKTNDTPVKNQGNTVDRYFWVDNIKPGTKTDKVQDLFKKYGKVLAVKVIRGGSDGNLLAFIKFDTPEDAQKCLDNLDNTEFQGNTIKILRERPNAPEDAKPDKRPVKRNFSPKRSFSPRRYQNNRNGGGGSERPFRGSTGGGGFQGGRRGDLRPSGGFRDGGFQDHRAGGRSSFGGGDRFDRFDRFTREREEDRRTREFEMRREKEFFDLEKERLEVERLKLKREPEELEKLSVEMSYDRFDKRQKTFNDSYDTGRRFDDYRRDDMKRERFTPERDARPISRFTSGSSLGASLPSSRPVAGFSSSSGRDRGYEQQKSWQSSSWDSHEPSSQQSGRSSWQSSSNFVSNSSSSHSDRARYNNGSSSSSGLASGQRISSAANDRSFGSSGFSSSGGHRRY